MKIKFWLISAVLIGILSSCDDGDLIVTSFDFEDQELQYCGGETNVVFFKINDESQESIALNISGTSELFLQDDISDISLSSDNFLTYRKFNGAVEDSYFCSSVPPSSPQVSVEYLAESGVAMLTNNLVIDDMDGVLEEIELVIDPLTGLNLDSDNDGLPNYFDYDDDGDNVATILELFASDEDEENNIFKDTDNDGVPDYLDPDDDGDGILTRNESTDGDINPLNDVNDDSSGLPDFLNPNIAITGTDNQEYIVHTYNRNASVNLILFDLVLTNDTETIIQETLDMGGVANVLNETVTITPDFN